MYVDLTNSLSTVWEPSKTKVLDDLAVVAHVQEIRVLDCPLREKGVQQDSNCIIRSSIPSLKCFANLGGEEGRDIGHHRIAQK